MTCAAATRETWTPPNLKGKELEDLVLNRAEKLKADWILTLKRSGQKVRKNPVTGNLVGIKSGPDLTGKIMGGRAIEIECKCCKSSSLSMRPNKKGDGAKPHQLKDLMETAAFGGLAYLVIHFNLNVLKTKTHEDFTVGVPVDPRMDFWHDVDRGKVKSLSRDMAREIGVLIPWGYHSNRARKLTPDIGVLIPGYKRKDW